VIDGNDPLHTSPVGVVTEIRLYDVQGVDRQTSGVIMIQRAYNPSIYNKYAFLKLKPLPACRWMIL
jgi:hypothetical protein